MRNIPPAVVLTNYEALKGCLLSLNLIYKEDIEHVIYMVVEKL